MECKRKKLDPKIKEYPDTLPTVGEKYLFMIIQRSMHKTSYKCIQFYRICVFISTSKTSAKGIEKYVMEILKAFAVAKQIL